MQTLALPKPVFTLNSPSVFGTFSFAFSKLLVIPNATFADLVSQAESVAAAPPPPSQREKMGILSVVWAWPSICALQGSPTDERVVLCTHPHTHSLQIYDAKLNRAH